MNIKPKPMSESVFAGKKNNIIISDSFIELLYGELLGDGSIICSKTLQGSFRESFGHDKLEYANWLKDIFVKNGALIYGNKIYRKKPSGKSKNISYSFGTKFYVEFGDIYNKWYINKNKELSYFNNRNNIKIIPKDIILTPKILLHWYIGDGSINKNGGSVLYTQGFTWTEVEFLRFKLLDFGIKTTHGKQNIIIIPRYYTHRLIEIIGECPVECYKYKWKLPSKKITKCRISGEINMNIIENYLGGNIKKESGNGNF
jgi:hypothetical protein